MIESNQLKKRKRNKTTRGGGGVGFNLSLPKMANYRMVSIGSMHKQRQKLGIRLDWYAVEPIENSKKSSANTYWVLGPIYLIIWHGKCPISCSPLCAVLCCTFTQANILQFPGTKLASHQLTHLNSIVQAKQNKHNSTAQLFFRLKCSNILSY
jgi:hypothetical protein